MFEIKRNQKQDLDCNVTLARTRRFGGDVNAALSLAHKTEPATHLLTAGQKQTSQHQDSWSKRLDVASVAAMKSPRIGRWERSKLKKQTTIESTNLTLIIGLQV